MARTHDPADGDVRRPTGLSVTLDAEGRHRRSRLAANSRHHPDLLDEDRRWLKNAAAEAYIRELVDTLLPLTDEQRSRLAALLHPGGGPDAGAPG
jgi:hypothetical protein